MGVVSLLGGGVAAVDLLNDYVDSNPNTNKSTDVKKRIKL
jgi:hypothetical protein